MSHRYADGWEFNGRSEKYLRDCYDLWSTVDASDNWYEVYRGGMASVVEECHTRALTLNGA